VTLDSESTTDPAGHPLRIAITGGGSGGHVSPAVAVIEELRRRVELDALWIGSRGGFESAAAADLGVPFSAIRVGKLRRYPSIQTLFDSVRVPVGTIEAWRILRAFRPEVVFSTGGFVSVPGIVASRQLGIPSITHEQTAHVGLATRINARFCDVVALSFDRSRRWLQDSRARIVVTGNPVRQIIHQGDAARVARFFHLPGDRPLVYITGGAQGSRDINAVVAEALPALLDDVQIVHQCGPRALHGDFNMLGAIAASLPPAQRARYRVRERIGAELGDLYAAADLVVGRAGAGTVAELAVAGAASLLVPLPGAEEQLQNALYLQEAGAAVILPQDELTARRLTDEVLFLTRDASRVAAMRKAARGAATFDAAARLADEIVALAGRASAHTLRAASMAS
jgi:UDP-N-acetylglucosamine--N-acetylmuramyl-(pentapeptide) pyrophosphoryl-undecaprenol N-acetylglucosamine transferase